MSWMVLDKNRIAQSPMVGQGVLHRFEAPYQKLAPIQWPPDCIMSLTRPQNGATTGTGSSDSPAPFSEAAVDVVS